MAAALARAMIGLELEGADSLRDEECSDQAMRSREPNRSREIVVEMATRAVDRALAGPLPEALARSIVKHDVLDRISAELLDAADAGKLELEETERLARRIVTSPAFQRMLLEALESQLTPELAERLLQHPETERMVEAIVSGPAVRAALARQTTSFAGEIATALRDRALKLDDAAGRAALPAYAGIATRGIAFAVDLALAGAIFLGASVMAGLVTWLAGGLRPGWLLGGLAAAVWTLVAGGYFVLFWTVAGQTPGMRPMRLRVLAGDDAAPGVGRSVVRFLGLLLAIAPLFAGFVPVLFDARRRGLHDFLAGTVVVHDDASP
jgi:uncharacterized RDD family membrane protein YckC